MGAQTRAVSAKKTAPSRKRDSDRKKTATRKIAGRKKGTTRKKSASKRSYSQEAGKSVENAMDEMKQGKLLSGRSGKKVTSRKQAIAIGLSEARERGEKVPPAPKRARSKSPSS